MAATIGFIIGAFFGMVLVGGFIGWAIKRIWRGVSWVTADAVALISLALLGGLTASDGTIEGYATYATTYLIAAFPAFFLLQRIRRRQSHVTIGSNSVAEPIPQNRRWKPIGLIAIVVLFAVAVVAMILLSQPGLTGGLLIQLPNWVVYGLVGAIIGATLALAGFALEKVGVPAGRFLPALTVALVVPITENVALPLLSPSIRCAVAESAVTNTPENQRLDEITVFNRMVVDCGARSVIYQTSVELASYLVTDEEWDFLQEDFNTLQCGNDDWREFIDAGWSIKNQYAFSDGSQREISAWCVGAA